MKFVERKIKGEIRLDVVYIENKKEKDVDKKNNLPNIGDWVLINMDLQDLGGNYLNVDMQDDVSQENLEVVQ